MDISDETMLRLLQSAMYGEAIGDALGVPYEGRTRHIHMHHDDRQ